MSEQAEEESLEAEPSPSPADIAGETLPAATNTDIQVQHHYTTSHIVKRYERNLVCYPFILFIRRGLGRRQQVCDSGNQNL